MVLRRRWLPLLVGLEMLLLVAGYLALLKALELSL